MERILAMPEEEARDTLKQVFGEFDRNHQALPVFYAARFEQVGRLVPAGRDCLSEERRLLIGAYFTHEYSYESTALFNPSIVLHPDQAAVPPGARRIVLSLRAIGEGHVSSISFRNGIIGVDGKIVLDPVGRFAMEPRLIPNPSYDKNLFEQKLYEVGLRDDLTAKVMTMLGPSFTRNELQVGLESVFGFAQGEVEKNNPIARGISLLADSNYEVRFDPSQQLSERVIFPNALSQKNGIEDARFVRFTDDDGSIKYYATYTAFDGKLMMPQLLETQDFLRFKFITLNGPAVQNKGLALFPRKIGGKFAMLARQDDENCYIMFSDNIHFWHETRPMASPVFPWEFIKIGNCGSPVETERGWLVLSHGVGPMRKYCIGAFLLDLNDPAKIIGRLKTPLISPEENERAGYVPNVVYTCGLFLHNDLLVIPYGIADYSTGFATVPLQDVMNAFV